jgi:hypothetical protein
LVLVYLVVVLVLILLGLIPALIVGVREETWSATIGIIILTLGQTTAAFGCFGSSKERSYQSDMPSLKLWR